MRACVLCLTVHVLSVWLVTGAVGKDIHHSHPSDRSYPNLTTDEPVTRRSELIPPASYDCYDPEFIDGDYRLCGDGYCRCQYNAADCSLLYGNLTYIPALPANVSTLIFAFNRLTAIKHDDFFQNVTDIVDLDLKQNGLSYISTGAFRSLVTLTALRLRSNNLNYTMLARVLSIQANLILLDLTDNQDLGTPPDGLFHSYPLPHIYMLCLMQMQMHHLNMSVFKPLTELRILDLCFNQLTRETLTPDFLPQLHELSLAGNSFQSFPCTCARLESFLPNLKVLVLCQNDILDIPTSSVCLPLLERLDCDHCYIIHIPTNAFGRHLFPSLLFLALSDLNYRPFELSIDGYAFNNSMLQTIILSRNAIDFSKYGVHPDSFAGCPHLKELLLDRNDFSSVSVQKLQRLFHHHSLIALNLVDTLIGQVSSDMFANLPNLTYFWLGANRLTDLPDGVFDRLEHLEQLGLWYNQISVVREATFSLATRQRLRLVKLSNNPFKCDCDLRWLRHWLTTQPGLFESRDSYMCDNLPNTTVQSFYVVDQACLWSAAVSKLIIATLILLMLPLTAGAVVYRYRWHIRLVMFEAVRGRGDRWRRLQEQDFRYDVFVSYDSGDLDWVLAHLIPELEEKVGLRLCLHQRDFALGAPIVENIEESVQASKKIIMLFSKKFAQSHWCQFELRLCLGHVLEHGDDLLVVLLESIPSRYLSPAMMAVMETVTYIEWENVPEAIATFWGRMRLALNEILV